MNTANFVTLTRVDGLPDGTAASFVVGEKIIALFRQGEKVFAINDICPHMGASLAQGHFEDGVVTCPWHAWRFKVCDGTWCDNPVIKTDAYEVRIVDDEVQVRIEPKEDRAP